MRVRTFLLLFTMCILVFGTVVSPFQTAGADTIESDGEFFVEAIPGSAGGGFEPHILAANGNDGNEWVYIDAPSGLLSRTSGYLWISKDHGDTWEFKTKGPGDNNWGGSGDSYTAVSKDGTIYYTDLLLATVTVQTSTDGGETWLRNPQASVTPIDDRQWFAMGPAIGGSPIKQSEALYLAYNQIPGGLYVQKAQLTKFGIAWRPCNAYMPVTTNVRARDHFQVDPQDGTIYMPNTEGSTMAMYVSRDGCASFDRYEVMSSDKSWQNIFTVADVDAAGNVYLGWTTQDNVSFARSTDKGQTWEVFNVTESNGTRALPWITAGDEGRIALTYYETNETGNPEEFGTEVNWSVKSAISINALDEVPTFHMMEIINYTHSGAIRLSGTGGDSDRDLGDFMSNDMDMYGRHIVTFGRDGNDGANVYNAEVMFGRQIDGPFLKEGVGPFANFTYWTDGAVVHVDGSRSFDMNGEGIVDYEWFWGDGTEDNASGPITTHDFKEDGKYNITLRVTNKLGMRMSMSEVVTIEAGQKRVFGTGPYIIGAIILLVVAIAYLMKKKRIGLGRKGRLKR
jgi:hypothetical protein